jgi:exopolysaccharide biosynthesis protein
LEIDPGREKFSREFSETWHPRTAIGRAIDGKVLLVTVDGRQPALSAGMSLEMLAKLLREFGAQDAANLDGGGSTTMYLLGKVVNSPSDKTGERPVSDAILLFPRVN